MADKHRLRGPLADIEGAGGPIVGWLVSRRGSERIKDGTESFSSIVGNRRRHRRLPHIQNTRSVRKIRLHNRASAFWAIIQAMETKEVRVSGTVIAYF
jgi:hypothetical protein